MHEDLELNTIENQLDDKCFEFMSKTTYRDKDFYIIFEKDELKNYLGFESTRELEEFLDEVTDYSWGYSGDWEECYNCGKAIYMEDLYEQDYWIDFDGSGIFCGDCVRNDSNIREAYLESISNNADSCNTFLSDSQLEEAGLIRLEGQYESGYYGRNDNPYEILNKLMDKYPYGKFVFNLTNNSRWNSEYEVWAFPGYEEGAIDNNEER